MSDALTVDRQTAIDNMSPMEERALELLGDGHPQEVVANTLGVTPARITQMMAVDWFAAEVSARKYAAVQAHTKADKKVDEVTDKVLAKIEKSLPLIHRPMELIRAFQVLNAAKRRGAPVDSTATVINQTVVQLSVPVAIINKYKTNSQSQVIEVNDKPFITTPSNMLPEISAQQIAAKQTEVAQLAEVVEDGLSRLAKQVSKQQNLSVPIAIRGQEISAEDL